MDFTGKRQHCATSPTSSAFEVLTSREVDRRARRAYSHPGPEGRWRATRICPTRFDKVGWIRVNPKGMASGPQAELGREGAVRVFEYRCCLQKGAPVEPEQFTFPAIAMVTDGVFGFRSDNADQLLSRGSLLLANPGAQYEISHDHEGGDRCLIFRFDPQALGEVASTFASSSQERVFARPVLPPIPRADALRKLAEQRLAAGGPALGLEELGLALAACVLKSCGGTPRRSSVAPAGSRRARDTVYTAVQHLEQSSGDELRLTDLAQRTGLSPFHFLRLFKREMGVTPYRFLMQSRLRRAIQLLRDTELPVTDIAFDVGFGDLSNFINFFRREVGCSPSRFRKAKPDEWAAALRLSRSA